MASRKGRSNKVTAQARSLAAKVLSDGLESKLWARFLQSEDERVAFEAFKLAKAYKSGQPSRARVDHDTERDQFEIVVRHMGLRDNLRG